MVRVNLVFLYISDFYSKKSEYNVLAGKDASRAHALWSLEAKDLNHDLVRMYFIPVWAFSPENLSSGFLTK